eukprot:5239955-Prymnesium_polylepis.1
MRYPARATATRWPRADRAPRPNLRRDPTQNHPAGGGAHQRGTSAPRIPITRCMGYCLKAAALPLESDATV